MFTASAAIGLGVASIAVGCTSEYRPALEPAGDAGAEAAVPADASVTDGGAEASPCGADLLTDKTNCGRCGHDCLGGACSAGKCQAVLLGSAPSNAPLQYIALSSHDVFVSSQVLVGSDEAGIWRLPRAGGAAEQYVSSFRYVNDIVVFGDTLYFVVTDQAADGGGTGGLYSCPISGAAPCAPTLVAAAKNPASLTVDKNRILYGDDAPGRGLMAYVPPAPPTVFVAEHGFGTNLFVDDQDVFYTAGTGPPQAAKLFEITPDAGTGTGLATYAASTALSGRLAGDATSVFFSAYDVKAPGGGLVRRISRVGGGSCDFGGSSNARPCGLHADASRVYWTNQGKGAAPPSLVDGSVVSCDRSGCCAKPDVLWTGTGAPTGLTGDAEALYFVTLTGGTVWKLAKP